MRPPVSDTGLAAVYLGFSVAFGPSMVRFMDERFAHRFAGGPRPRRPPKYGMARAGYEWREFGKAAVACLVSCALLLGAIAAVGDAERTESLPEWIDRLLMVLAIWSLWPITYTLWPARPRGTAARTGEGGPGPDGTAAAPFAASAVTGAPEAGETGRTAVTGETGEPGGAHRTGRREGQVGR